MITKLVEDAVEVFEAHQTSLEDAYNSGAGEILLMGKVEIG